MLARTLAPIDPGQAALPKQAAGLVGLVSGEPMADWPFPSPIWGQSDRVGPRSAEGEDWLTPWLRSARSF